MIESTLATVSVHMHTRDPSAENENRTGGRPRFLLYLSYQVCVYYRLAHCNKQSFLLLHNTPPRMAETLPEELPQEPAAVSTLLDGILERGIEKLLQEVKLKNYTQAPYGRDPEPSPLLSEEAFLQNGCLEEEGDDEPRFDFSYGFSPLQFLADYVRWSHPDSVKERRLERIRCVERLQALAVHAKRQLSTASTLRNIAMAQGSGVVWGPMCAARSPTATTSRRGLTRSGLSGSFGTTTATHCS